MVEEVAAAVAAAVVEEEVEEEEVMVVCVTLAGTICTVGLMADAVILEDVAEIRNPAIKMELLLRTRWAEVPITALLEM